MVMSKVIVFGVLLAPFLMAAGILVWAGIALLTDAWRCRRTSIGVADRLGPLQPSVADEVQEWLRRQ
jgi:hypothetical protein